MGVVNEAVDGEELVAGEAAQDAGIAGERARRRACEPADREQSGYRAGLVTQGTSKP